MSSEAQPGYVPEPSDEEVEQFIAQHEDGASYEEIGELMGLTRVRVQQIASKALLKALRNATVRGLMCPHFAEPQDTVWDRLGN